MGKENHTCVWHCEHMPTMDVLNPTDVTWAMTIRVERVKKVTVYIKKLEVIF